MLNKQVGPKEYPNKEQVKEGLTTGLLYGCGGLCAIGIIELFIRLY